MNIEKCSHVYFLGIGGIGMSALARYFREKGKSVSGYDKTETTLTKKLVEEGIDIHYDDDPGNIPDDVDLVVLTPAIPKDLKELAWLREREIPVVKRAVVLGLLCRPYPTIAVAGTHGKTTTSSILTHLLRTAGIPITAFLGGLSVDIEGNYFRSGDEWYIAEADEFDRSFLHLEPDIAAIMAVEPDHLDIYGSEEEVYRGFRDFAAKTASDGKLIVRDEDLQLLKPLPLPKGQVKTFGYERGKYQVKGMQVVKDNVRFDFVAPGVQWRHLEWKFPGTHNLINACAAITISLQLGVEEGMIRKALSSFRGIERRFERVYAGGLVLIDDYAHHPTELKAAIGAAREMYPDRWLTGIFQPHLYTRTRDFAEGFAKALEGLDQVVMVEIYPAREEPIRGITSRTIFDMIDKENKVLTTKQDLIGVLRSLKIEVLMTLGAGDIGFMVPEIKRFIKELDEKD